MRFSAATAQRYMGTIERAYLCYCADEPVRANAASGGAVSALLLELLQKGRIDAALVTRIRCQGGRIEPEVFLATDRQGILSAQTSKYFDVPLVARGLELLRGFSGKVAVVGLPCHVTAFRRLAERDPALAGKIRCCIALFCGHSSQRYLLDKVLAGQGIDESQVREFAFRKGPWRGKMTGRLADGSEFAFPFNRFSYYHNLNFFCLRRCLQCHDHTGYDSDFSAGDAWLPEMKRQPIKHSILLSRSAWAGEALEQMVQSGRLLGRPIDQATVFRSQKRSLIYHYNVSARSQAGRLWGVRIADTVRTKVRWNDWLAANLILMNHRLSHDARWRDWIFRLPRPIIVAYFLLLKLLQNF